MRMEKDTMARWIRYVSCRVRPQTLEKAHYPGSIPYKSESYRNAISDSNLRLYKGFSPIGTVI